MERDYDLLERPGSQPAPRRAVRFHFVLALHGTTLGTFGLDEDQQYSPRPQDMVDFEIE